MDRDTFIARVNTLRDIMHEIKSYESLEEEYGVDHYEYDSDSAFVAECIYSDGRKMTADNMKHLNVLYRKYTTKVSH